MLDGELVPLSPRIRQTVDGLIINNVTLSDAGVYSCLSVNEAGTARSSGTLTVHGMTACFVGKGIQLSNLMVYIVVNHEGHEYLSVPVSVYA